MKRNHKKEKIETERKGVLRSQIFNLFLVSRFFVRDILGRVIVWGLECIKLIKAGMFKELDSLDSYPVHFGIIEGLVTSLCLASKLE